MRVVEARYGPDTGRSIAPLADVWLPEKPRGSSVLLVHGGFFVAGHRQMLPMRLMAERLVAQGHVAVTFDYRLVFRGAQLDDSVHDVVEAARWWEERAPDFDVDPRRTAMVGLSAGAALMLLAAPQAPPSRVVSVYGVTDFARVPLAGTTVPQRILLASADPARWVERSPAFTFDLPVPTLLVHGTRDVIVPADHSVRLAEFRRSLKLPVDLHLYHGAGHGFLRRPHHPQFEDAMAVITGFLAKERR